MFELDFRNIIVLVSLAIHAVLLWVLFRYGRKTPGGRAYTLAILAIVGWVFPMWLYRAHLFGEVLIWARLLYIMASFTSTTFFIFSFVFPRKRKMPLWLQLFILVENILIIVLCLHPTLIIKAVEIMQTKEDIIIWGPLYSVYSSHISLFFLAGFILLFLKMRKEVGLLRKQIRSILIGYFLGANLAMVTNLILPWFGYFELNWLGQFFSTLVAAFTTYAILRHRLLDIKLIATEGFILVLNLFLFFRFILSFSPADFVINGIVMIAVMGISYLLIRSVHVEVRRREELAQLAKTLEKANFRLKELDRQKTDFLSIAAHQLRTPLSIMKGFIELIQDGAYGKITKKTYQVLNEMDESNERLVKLVDEFLDVTRIEQGRTKFSYKNYNLNELIEGVIKELSQRAKNKGLKIVWERNKRIRQVYMDEEKIRHVIFNFIDNAIKYSDKGKIKILLEKDDKGIIVRVKDNGLGFGKIDQANFFQKFYRGKNVRVTNVNGTGLGLYVCRMFIETHGGEVWAESGGSKKGSEFGFWIPGRKQ